ncbi:serine hydrolase domain-containing protein [Kitasatospora paracochleata]|uniref:CubicO group peptidase (Beta-lactamase class C family) n=1 Tax=Kitasatospora paracochleata TaxID=58354 RepID=A0ABT1J4I5_9ACTN|nr:serine hydrolase domain-containing protein [Kitasatospora paracochleata]MCP2312330.1 CubicO group peptidase (beta-lactamase class C family) [Kitasatospora paracochleata]
MTVEIWGETASGFEPVREAFARNFRDYGELGAAFSLYVDGRKVVDLWGGDARAEVGARPAPAVPWTADTAQVLRSVTKGVSAAAALHLTQRGHLDLDAPVAAYWPEFKAAGKERIPVRWLLSHQAGLPVLDVPLRIEDVLAWEPAAAAVAAQAPAWEPGTAHGYHPLTFGWLVGEVVRRAAGRSIGQYVAEEFARPLGLDLWIGLPAGAGARVGRLVDLPAPDAAKVGPNGMRVRPKQNVVDAYRDPASLTARAFAAVRTSVDLNDPAVQAAEVPGAGGIGTARSVARFFAALIGAADRHGGAPGERLPALFEARTLAEAMGPAVQGPDRILIVNTTFGHGFFRHGPTSPMASPASFGHPGRGGSLGFADPELGIGFGYVTNGMQPGVTGDIRSRGLIAAVKACLDR